MCLLSDFFTVYLLNTNTQKWNILNFSLSRLGYSTESRHGEINLLPSFPATEKVSSFEGTPSLKQHFAVCRFPQKRYFSNRIGIERNVMAAKNLIYFLLIWKLQGRTTVAHKDLSMFTLECTKSEPHNLYFPLKEKKYESFSYWTFVVGCRRFR